MDTAPRSTLQPERGARILSRSLRFSIFWRSLFLQAAWNYGRMQNLGFVFALMPVLRKEWRGADLSAAVKRHLEHFNTQPFMAGFALGLSARLEQEAAATPPEQQESVFERMRLLKGAVGTASAAIGDRLFWGTLRPLSLVVAIALWWLGGLAVYHPRWFSSALLVSGAEGGEQPLWHCSLAGYSCPPCDIFGFGNINLMYGWKIVLGGLLAGLLLYNAFALWVRWRAIKYGYDCAGSSACGIELVQWQWLIRRMRIIGFTLAICVAAFAGIALFTEGIATGGHSVLMKYLLAPVVFAAALYARRRGFACVYLYVASIAAAAALCFI